MKYTSSPLNVKLMYMRTATVERRGCSGLGKV